MNEATDKKQSEMIVKDMFEAKKILIEWMLNQGIKEENIIHPIFCYGERDGRWDFDVTRPHGNFLVNARTGAVEDCGRYFSKENAKDHKVGCGCNFCTA
jgi:hypothetical protein